MPALLARAPGDAARGAVMVIGDIRGARTPFYDHLAVLLADAGLDAVVPEFFFREGPLTEDSMEAVFGRKARLDENRTLRDLATTVRWLRDRDGFDGQRVGVLGFCMGGTLALDLTVSADDLATAVYYGFTGDVPGPRQDTDPPRPLDVADQIRGPIIGFWGDQDQRVGIHNVRAFAEAMAEHEVDFEHTVFEGLDHGFLAANFEPGSPGHDEARRAWDQTLAFFGQNC